MKKGKIIIVIITTLTLVGLQFIPTLVNEQLTYNPNDFTNVYEVPKEITIQLKNSCYDCHSNFTEYPWYGKLQPMNIILAQHITDGKKELNLSEFGTYSDRKKRSKLKSMINQIKNDEMPLTSYTLLHWNANFTEEDKENIIAFLDTLLRKKETIAIN